MVLEVTEQETPLPAFLQVEKVPALEVAGQDVAGPVLFRQPVIIIERLIAGLLEVQSGRFLFDDQGARPIQIDEALLVARQIPDSLFVGCDLASADSKTVEEVIVESLRFALFVTSLLVTLREGCRASADFGPLKSHYPQLRRETAVRQWRRISRIANSWRGGLNEACRCRG